LGRFLRQQLINAFRQQPTLFDSHVELIYPVQKYQACDHTEKTEQAYVLVWHRGHVQQRPLKPLRTEKRHDALNNEHQCRCHPETVEQLWGH
jgi:hypothetical protein